MIVLIRLLCLGGLMSIGIIVDSVPCVLVGCTFAIILQLEDMREK